MFGPELWKQIQHYSSFRQTGISLRYMVNFGRNVNPGSILQGGQFLRSELPVRLAARVAELHNLPRSASEMPSILRVKKWYAESFRVSTAAAARPNRLLTLLAGID